MRKLMCVELEVFLRCLDYVEYDIETGEDAIFENDRLYWFTEDNLDILIERTDKMLKKFEQLRGDLKNGL